MFVAISQDCDTVHLKCTNTQSFEAYTSLINSMPGELIQVVPMVANYTFRTSVYSDKIKLMGYSEDREEMSALTLSWQNQNPEFTVKFYHVEMRGTDKSFTL